MKTPFAPFAIRAIQLLAAAVLLSAHHESSAAETPRATASKAEDQIDFDRARQLLQKRRNGERLTPDEEAYLKRAMEARRAGAARRGSAGADRGNGPSAPFEPRETTGLKPLSDMSADDVYQSEDGGLYGSGRNVPPPAHAEAAAAAIAQIQPLDSNGHAAEDGKIVFVSISMSNATQEFSRFKERADSDPAKSPLVTIVDCAQGGQAMAEWVDPDGGPWREAQRRITAAGVSEKQVQVAWVKLANKGPRGDLKEHGRKLQRDTLAVLQNAKAHFPNLRVVYLGSRIYAGYAIGPLNPEPYAYESAFVCRWLIQDQIKGAPELNWSSERGAVKAPLLLWGPYLWADGLNPRKTDGLVWKREDLARDGTHPSQSGRDKVAGLLLNFFKRDPLARSWFARER